MTNHKHDRDAAVDRLLAGMARGSQESAGACLDAQTLAAWADDALSAGELAAAQAHAADCGRCQAVLAAIAKTVPTPAARPQLWRMPSLRWLLPLNAAAAAAVVSIIVWFVIPRREAPVNVRQVSQIAESVPPPASAPAPPAAVVSPAEKPASRTRREQQALPQDNTVETFSRADKAADANAVLGGPARSADARLENTPAPEAPAAPAASPPQPAAAARAFSFAARETIVVSSNPASRWRILPAGAVQRSSDGGGTWQTQNTGVSETLSAGASPSPSVCWLVGPGGIVLLSSDGLTWKRLAFPETVPLIAVRATDNQTAIVTTADGRDFATEDGGLTWVRAPGR